MTRAKAAAAAALAGWVAVATAAPDARRSGFDDMTPAVQAMQRDPTQHPAQLELLDGAQRFERDCAGCHGAERMRGVAARYPAWDETARAPLTLAGRINACRERALKQPAWAPGDAALLGLEAFIAERSKGLPIAPPADPRLAPARALGQQLWRTRFGQLALSCTQCHDDAAGGKLAGATIPQGHPTAYPVWRLEWQGLGSLSRRLRNCMTGVRAEPFADGSPEAVALEAFLMQRAAGMPHEGVGVRP